MLCLHVFLFFNLRTLRGWDFNGPTLLPNSLSGLGVKKGSGAPRPWSSAVDTALDWATAGENSPKFLRQP